MQLITDINNGKYNSICILLILFLFIITFSKSKEHFALSEVEKLNLVQTIKNLYTSDIDAIQKLARVPSSIANGLKLSGEVTISGNLNIKNNTSIKGNVNMIGECNYLPRGIIISWAGANIPNGWQICDGTNGTPDLRGRFILGYAGTVTNLGVSSNKLFDRGGEEKVTLNVDNIPAHAHNFFTSYDSKSGSSGYHIIHDIDGTPATNKSKQQTGGTGGSQSHENMPAFYVLAYIMKL